MLRKKLTTKMKNYFDKDQRRINHALKVTDFAEELISRINSPKLNKKVIIYAAILHDVGIKEAERKYNSSKGKYQEIEGPPIAKEILTSLNVKEPIIEEVCNIIAHHHSPGKINTLNFKILYDADWLVNFPDQYNLNEQDSNLINAIDKLYFTKAAKDIARDLFFKF